jgi:hypothetical protein
VVSFPQVSPPKPCIRLSSPTHVLHAPPISFFSILSLRIKFGEHYKSLSPSLFSFFPLPYFFFSLRPKYLPQHPTLQHPQST